MIFLKFLVLDGNSILNRAFYGIRMLSNKKGQMTNGIYGFLTTMQKLLNETNPDAVAVAFDLPAPTFRHKMYDGYKANRKKMPEELASQVPILKELLSALGYNPIMCEGYEADDILGTFAKYCEEKNYECVLATGDRDSLQLISPNVTVRIASTKFGKPESTLYDEEKVKEVYNVSPIELIDVKALQGDSSDNIPGVKGIGEKTARDLVSKFGSLDNIYSNLENSTEIKESVKNKLLNGKKEAYMSYELGKINRSAPIKITDEEYVRKPVNTHRAKEIMIDLEFFSLMDKLGLEKNEQESSEIKIISSDISSELISEILKEETLFFLADYSEKGIEKIYAEHKNEIYVINSKNTEEFLKNLKNSKSEKVTYDIKKLYREFQKKNWEFNGEKFDVMLALYLLNPSAKDYDILRAAQEYSIALPKLNPCENLSEEDFIHAEKVFLMKKLFPIFKKELENRCQFNLLSEIEEPLSEVLASMENEGFFVDKSGLEYYEKKLDERISELKNSIYEISSFEFNINSPKQLGFVLFEKLGLPKGKKGKTGYSTGAETLEKLKGYHEIIDLILEYRALSKLKSTYCDGMISLITEKGRIHSSFNQTETRTGRISSTEPNLQNIPVRTERGRELRKFFKAEPGNVLIDADYSQIELRILAHMSKDSNMIDAFKNHEDIHAITASQILNLPINMVTPEMRFRAKAVNFGIVYGMSAFSLAEDLKISRYEAQNYINRYLEHYKGVDEYMHKVIDLAKERGYAETMLCRRRYLPELESPNRVLRSFGERVARNMPIQGSAADIIKIAMINTYKRLKKENLKSKLILQVHDELIIEAPRIEAEKAKEILKNEMENAVKISVPLEVHVSVGDTWYDAKD
mgnify:FL=1